MPIIHLIKIFAYSLKSILLFIKILIFLSLKLNSICLIVCSLAFVSARLRPLWWFLIHCANQHSQNDNIHGFYQYPLMFNSLIEHRCTLRMITDMAFISILVCPIALLNIDVLFFYDNLQKKGWGYSQYFSNFAQTSNLCISNLFTRRVLRSVSFWFQKLKKNALQLFTYMQYFAVHSKWPSVSYL